MKYILEIDGHEFEGSQRAGEDPQVLLEKFRHNMENPHGSRFSYEAVDSASAVLIDWSKVASVRVTITEP